MLFGVDYIFSYWQICFSFLFVHVAQLSIALGRHTLPHVSVKGSERWRGKKNCIYDAVLSRGLTCGSGFAAVSIAGITKRRIRGYGRGG